MYGFACRLRAGKTNKLSQIRQSKTPYYQGVPLGCPLKKSTQAFMDDEFNKSSDLYKEMQFFDKNFGGYKEVYFNIDIKH